MGLFGGNNGKCARCGAALPHIGGDSRGPDDLLKNSAIYDQQLCSRCKRGDVPEERSIARTVASNETMLPEPEPEPELSGDDGDVPDSEESKGGFGKYVAAAVAIIVFIINALGVFDDDSDKPSSSDTIPAYGEPVIVNPVVIVEKASPAGNPGIWIMASDYPAKALSAKHQGTTRFDLTIHPAGYVAECRIVQSSGYAELDDATCDLITKRARFNPARDAKAMPVGGTYSNQVRWQIPK